ncbi:MAG: hypothetical protein HOC91_02900 [Nitrospinaceae bacterium]|nr:hypothetical protein [Nitrospinaceae bacterium]MBT3822701.1 hypothetical protein [Nitrospinaceae bacterium]MBT4095087.1 hypothetical protein [Nitrospinaceae bacterium]MBT4429442.1 hypothetical protein [Nitrospinaceae bacterium]MBT5367691.1 hypothetical protein [Nitrospinaceae bacterium]
MWHSIGGRRTPAAADGEKRGFDQPLAMSYAVAAGTARTLGLDPARAANTLALAGVT